MRQAVKSLFVSEIMNRDFTPVIASHNMRELEDVCDHVGFLHKGGILLSRELEDMKFHIHKIQCVLPGSDKRRSTFERIGRFKERTSGITSDTYCKRDQRRNTSESTDTESNILRSDSIDTGGDIYQRNGGGRL